MAGRRSGVAQQCNSSVKRLHLPWQLALDFSSATLRLLATHVPHADRPGRMFWVHCLPEQELCSTWPSGQAHLQETDSAFISAVNAQRKRAKAGICSYTDVLLLPPVPTHVPQDA